MKKLWIVPWTLAILLVLTSAALAAPRDRDRDGLPDRWERKHGLSVHRASANADPDRDRVDNRNEYREGTNPKRRDSDRDRRLDGREDRDHDGLSNVAEDRSGNDPGDPDSDDDGIGDAEEHAGTVASFAGGRLTIALAGGGTLSATVDDDTDVGCGSENEAELMQGLMGWDSAEAASAGGDDPGADDGADDGDDDQDYGDGLDAGDSERMDDEHDFADACPARWLKPGVNVREASLDDSTAAAFGEVEFIYGR